MRRPREQVRREPVRTRPGARLSRARSGTTSLDDAEQSSVLGAFVTAFEFAGGVGSGTNPERTVTPVVTRGILCGQFALDVASGSSRTVAVRIEDDHVPADVDVDQLTLTCTAGG